MEKSIGTQLLIIEFRCFKSDPLPKVYKIRQEFSELTKCGTVIECHLCNKLVCEISALLDISWSTVSDIIGKWKHLGMAATQPRSGRPLSHREGSPSSEEHAA